jgi:hypothetical protein
MGLEKIGGAESEPEQQSQEEWVGSESVVKEIVELSFEEQKACEGDRRIVFFLLIVELRQERRVSNRGDDERGFCLDSLLDIRLNELSTRQVIQPLHFQDLEFPSVRVRQG